MSEIFKYSLLNEYLKYNIIIENQNYNCLYYINKIVDNCNYDFYEAGVLIVQWIENYNESKLHIIFVQNPSKFLGSLSFQNTNVMDQFVQPSLYDESWFHGRGSIMLAIACIQIL